MGFLHSSGQWAAASVRRPQSDAQKRVSSDRVGAPDGRPSYSLQALLPRSSSNQSCVAVVPNGRQRGTNGTQICPRPRDIGATRRQTRSRERALSGRVWAVANLASDLSKDQQMAPQIAHHQHSSLGDERPNYHHHHQALCTSLLARLAAPRSHNRPERLGRPPLAHGTVDARLWP